MRKKVARSRSRASPIRVRAVRMAASTPSGGRLMNCADMSAISRSNSRWLKTASRCACSCWRCAVTSPTDASTKQPSSVRKVLTVISTGNREPSRRCPNRSGSAPAWRAFAAAWPPRFAAARHAECVGHEDVHPLPDQFAVADSRTGARPADWRGRSGRRCRPARRRWIPARVQCGTGARRRDRGRGPCRVDGLVMFAHSQPRVLSENGRCRYRVPRKLAVTFSSYRGQRRNQLCVTEWPSRSTRCLRVISARGAAA